MIPKPSWESYRTWLLHHSSEDGESHGVVDCIQGNSGDGTVIAGGQETQLLNGEEARKLESEAIGFEGFVYQFAILYVLCVELRLPSAESGYLVDILLDIWWSRSASNFYLNDLPGLESSETDYSDLPRLESPRASWEFM